MQDFFFFKVAIDMKGCENKKKIRKNRASDVAKQHKQD